MKLISVLLALALAAVACGSSEPPVPAVAASSAQEAEAEAEAAEAVVAAAEGPSPFCAAVDELVSYPFVDFPFADETIASAASVGADAEALKLSNASYRAVAEVVPADAPNIIKNYFAAVPDAVDDSLRPEESVSLNPDYLPSLLVAGSIRVSDVAGFIEGACSAARLDKQPFTPLLTLDPDAMLAPSLAGFCETLGGSEELFVALEASGGDDQTEIPLMELVEPATFALTGLVDADANRSTTAFLRALNVLSASAFVDEEAAFTAFFLLQSLDGMVIADDLRTACPEVSDPGPWLVDLFATPFEIERAMEGVASAVTDSISISDGSFSSTTTFDGDSSSTTTRQRVASVDGSLLADAVNVTVSDVFFERTHIDGMARDTDEIFVEILFSFDRGHELTAADFSLTAPDGTMFGADPDQLVALDLSLVRFSIDRDVEMTAGWELRVGDQTLDL